LFDNFDILLAWMSPEVITSGHYSHGSDIWALGCTLIELITGEAPWQGVFLASNPYQLMFQIAGAKTAPPIPKDKMSEELYDLISLCFDM
jgi:serine/threonine protein kinase